MIETERNVIVEFLRSSEPDMDYNPSSLSTADLVDILIEKVTELELDYSILSTAFVNKVNPDRFENFHEAVMNQYEMISDGAEIPESVLDRLAAQYR
ncbi:MAG: hypothetical protein KBD76_08035 [Bacteriovorax sp.]|jgi:hypothetical protein|nr:hypothetical protein [Bacteriovorax sp.]